ncbi:alpha/beta fold hydrolase [Polynucleobacter paneuropaeus]|jgi:carboxylesterase|uniref:alpha/beta hydrolase n=1 Tax=Polynucleobacter paneuropaeus TaxID=2527775 RepID=UPI001BFDB93D|nr:alpha/beta fold hydrolase [Polynucleobacter paneuropaeus]MBT8528182.1 alpha/beta fold hydrolase [Polynucleobacter paneuropaeus]MBT8542681.1 alpha/beta fold hydrolase [Polynucleobacter paneuropaeus]MBT8557603.1 alpha/beta fold hydrolase [Polynucleobacter paneuropaeus]MBT8561579.1 alpha/beta fold hydrolase [Polynucleobacter paneuropaeus]MBT8569734.1 alpha/beta fold hydrolase [Polynucleobacter paneuropaeus]
MTSIAEQPDRYETFYQGNTGHAVVLLPGLCGSELEMGAIPRLLKQSNHTYTIPRIKGYSAHTGLTGYQEWIDGVDQFVTDLSQTHDSISIAGLSMGATLALAVAEQNSKVHSLVILSPVFLFDGWSVPWYYPFLALLYKIGIRNWHFKEREPFGVKNVELRRHIQKAVMANSVSELGAAHLPAVHLYQSLELVKATKKELSSITADTLIIHAVDDETASPKNPEIIIDRISSETCRMIWLGNSYHMITVDNEREVVANEVNNFINQTIEKEKIVDRLSIDTPSLVIKNRNRS